MAQKDFVLYQQTLLGRDGKWAAATDIACWWCTEPFEGVPKCVPADFSDTRGWSVIGCFCSWPCAKAWLHRQREFDNPVNHMELKMMAAKVFGYLGAEIHPAPPPYILQKFGGPWDIQTFREHVNADDMPPSEMVTVPLLPASMAMAVGNLNEITDTSTRHEEEDEVVTSSTTRAPRKKKKKEPAPKRGKYHDYLETHTPAPTQQPVVDEPPDLPPPKRLTRSSSKTMQSSSNDPAPSQPQKKCRGSLAGFRMASNT